MGINLGSLLVYGGTLEPYLSQFDVEKLEMASVMGICAGLVGPKSENVEKVLVFKAFLKGSSKPRGRQSREQLSEPGPFRGRSEIFDVECFVYISRIVFPTEAGSTFSENS